MGVGDFVLYWITGERIDDPCAALVTKKYESSRSLDLTIYVQGARWALKSADGVRHIEDPDYSEHTRKENGAWEPTTSFVRNLAHLVDHD